MKENKIYEIHCFIDNKFKCVVISNIYQPELKITVDDVEIKHHTHVIQVGRLCNSNMTISSN